MASVGEPGTKRGTNAVEPVPTSRVWMAVEEKAVARATMFTTALVTASCRSWMLSARIAGVLLPTWAALSRQGDLEADADDEGDNVLDAVGRVASMSVVAKKLVTSSSRLALVGVETARGRAGAAPRYRAGGTIDGVRPELDLLPRRRRRAGCCRPGLAVGDEHDRVHLAGDADGLGGVEGRREPRLRPGGAELAGVEGVGSPQELPDVEQRLRQGRADRAGELVGAEADARTAASRLVCLVTVAAAFQSVRLQSGIIPAVVIPEGRRNWPPSLTFMPKVTAG